MTSMPIVDDVGNPKFIKCKNCDEEVDCDEDGIFCLNYGEHIEINLCQDCFDDKKDKFKKDGWECDDFEDEDEDEDEYIRKAFLNKYLVPNYYAKEHLCEDYDDERWERFKEFVHESNSSLEEIGFLMDHCKESFEEDEDDEDEDED
tara:strand:- start:814 stop:1254 length:441 start_codon:yes stop_codon:yes gene_type:complete